MKNREERKECFPGTVPTKKYKRRKGRPGYRQGCFGKSNAEKKGYKPHRFKKDFTVDRRSK